MTTRTAFVAIALVTALGCSTSSGVKPLPPTVTEETTRDKDKVTRVETETVQAKVVAINQKTRMVTLEGADGEDITFRVDDAVKNLPQVRKGDLVTAVYRRALAFRLRKPGEADPGTQTGSAVMTAKPGEMPAAVGVESVQVTTTVSKLDRAKSTITLRGPKGKSVTVAVQDPTVFDRVKKGDKVEVTYTEAVAVAVDKP